MLDKIHGRTKVLEKSLDAAWLRNEVISQNIANVDTPNYKRKTVKFEEYLDKAMGSSSFKGIKTDKRHISIGSGSVDDADIKVSEDYRNDSIRLDGNNVDIESEMAEMAKNTIKYNTLIQSLNASFRRIKSVISEGRK